MPWNLPIFALAMALALGVVLTMPGRPLGMNVIPVSSFNLFRGTQAPALAMAAPTRATACGQRAPALVPSPTKPVSALNWAASLHGWPEGPTVQAWRQFAGWTKQAWRHPRPCAGSSSLA